MMFPEVPEKAKTYLWILFLTTVGAAVQVAINKFGGSAVVPTPPTTIQVSPVVVSQSPEGVISAYTVSLKDK